MRKVRRTNVVLRALIFMSLISSSNSFASTPAELIISCHGKLKGEYEVTPDFGKKIDLSIFQNTDNEEYNWLIKVKGDVNLDLLSNGPINADGTTASKNGDENLIFFQTPTEGIVLKRESGQLSGSLSYVQEHPQHEDHWFLVEYALDCQRSDLKISQEEAMIYNVRSEIADKIMDHKNTWINGVGVIPSETMKAIGILIFSRDEIQKEKFIIEFKKRGLLIENGGALFYNYNNENGQISQVPISFEITGDITPIP